MAVAPQPRNPDPEVESLLNDLPPPTLPDVLVKQGWGVNTIAQMVEYGYERPRPPTEGSQAPTFDRTCIQCGRPFEPHRGRDHAGTDQCDGLLVDAKWSDYHTDAVAVVYERPYEHPPPLLALPYQKITVGPAVTAPTCGATKGHIFHNKKDTHQPKQHIHQCDHQRSHFGFHECTTCHHLWR